MRVLGQFGLFDDTQDELLKGAEAVTWATFVNGIAKRKGFLDAHEYFVKTYGEADGKQHLQKLERHAACSHVHEHVIDLTAAAA